MTTKLVTERCLECSTKYIGSTGGKFIAPIEPIADKTNWIEIKDRAGLEIMVNNLNGKYYFSADIDLAGEEWVLIGNNSTDSNASRFTGTFDGQVMSLAMR